MTTTLEQLTKRIEQVIHEHIAGSQLAAAEAVARAFVLTGRSRRVQSATTRATPRGRRRPAAEIAALTEQIYEAVCKKPGETMAVLALDTGLTAGELHLPMAHLKRAGKVRSAGQRHLTRYFPMAARG